MSGCEHRCACQPAQAGQIKVKQGRKSGGEREVTKWKGRRGWRESKDRGRESERKERQNEGMI